MKPTYQGKRVEEWEIKPLLTKLYLDEKLGAPIIAIKLQISKQGVYNLLRKYEIATRSSTEAMNLRKSKKRGKYA